VLENSLAWVTGEMLEGSLVCDASEVILDVTQTSSEHDVAT
jgi:hypothetical protein